MSLCVAEVVEGARKVFSQEGSSLQIGKYFYPRKIYEEVSLKLDLFPLLQDIENNDLSYLLFRNSPPKNFLSTAFTRQDILDEKSSIVQLDIDWQVEEIDFSTYTNQQILDYVKSELQFPFTGVSCAGKDVEAVVQRSNKAHVKGYQNKVSARIYVKLSEALDQEGLKQLFSAWAGTGVGQVDPAMFNRSQPHLVRKPLLINLEVQALSGETITYHEGGALNVDAIRQHPDYGKATSTQREILNTVALSRASDFTKEESEFLLEQARAGEFDGHRDRILWDILRQDIWSQGHPTKTVTWMTSPENRPLILGDKSDKDINYKINNIYNYYSQKYFDTWDKYVYSTNYPVTRVSAHDLKKTDLTPFFSNLEKNNYQGIAIVKSSHGTSKTMGILPKVIENLRNRLGREPRISYVSPLRSTCINAASKLGLKTHLNEKDYVDKEKIENEDKLAVCLSSVGLLAERKPDDLLVIDEVNDTAKSLLESYVPNGVLNDLHAYAQKCRFTLLLDADCDQETLFLAEQINPDTGAILWNDTSWIDTQNWWLWRNQADWINCLIKNAKKGKRIFVSVDASDESSAEISSLVELINDETNGFSPTRETIAVGWDKDTLPKNIKENPDIYLSELIENGIKIVVVSPCIKNGWRFLGEREIKFDMVFVSAIRNWNEAPIILQRAQRTPVERIHLLINYKERFHYNKEELKQPYIRLKSTANNFESQLKQIVQQKRLIHRGNQFLHTICLLKKYGVKNLHIVNKTGNKQIGDYLQQRKRNLKDYRIALEYSWDPDAVSFYCEDWLMGDINTYKPISGIKLQDYIDIRKAGEALGHNWRFLRKFMRIVSASEKQCRDWDYRGAPPTADWSDDTDWGFSLLRKVYQGVVAHALQKDDFTLTDLTELFLTNKSISIRVKDLKDTELEKLWLNNRKFLKEKIDGIGRTNTSLNEAIKVILNNLGFKVSSTLKGNKIKEAKNALLDSHKRVYPKECRGVGARLSYSERIIQNKMDAEEPLTQEEEEYFKLSDFLIHAKRINFINKPLANEILQITKELNTNEEFIIQELKMALSTSNLIG